MCVRFIVLTYLLHYSINSMAFKGHLSRQETSNRQCKINPQENNCMTLNVTTLRDNKDNNFKLNISWFSQDTTNKRQKNYNLLINESNIIIHDKMYNLTDKTINVYTSVQKIHLNTNYTIILTECSNENTDIKHCYAINYTTRVTDEDNRTCYDGNILNLNATRKDNTIYLKWAQIKNYSLHFLKDCYMEIKITDIDGETKNYTVELKDAPTNWTSPKTFSKQSNRLEFEIKRKNYSCIIYYNQIIIRDLDEKSDTGNNKMFLIIIVILVTTGCLLTVVLVIKFRSNQVGKLNNTLSIAQLSRLTSNSVPLHYNHIYIEQQLEDSRRKNNLNDIEIDFTQINVIQELGFGAFGRVLLANKVQPETNNFDKVAVKTLKSDSTPEDLQDFLSEISTMKKLGSHENVVKMIGCCTKQQPFCLIMEYIPNGDLHKYLRNLRNSFERNHEDEIIYTSGIFDNSDSEELSLQKNPSHGNNGYRLLELNSPTPLKVIQKELDDDYFIVNNDELQDFALQIARGMEYVEKQNITHRDLAARNVLIDSRKTLKIGDFGLSRNGIYVPRKTKKVPLRWLSIEAIRESIFSNKSDAWAYAVVLWEIGTLGERPYSNIRDIDLLYYLLHNNRLDKPISFNKEIYSLMRQCWHFNPESRPSFAEIVKMLENITKYNNYISFCNKLEFEVHK